MMTNTKRSKPQPNGVDPKLPLMTEAADDFSKKVLQEDPIHMQSKVPHLMSKQGSFCENSLPVFESQIVSTYRMGSPRQQYMKGPDMKDFESFRHQMLNKDTQIKDDFRHLIKPESTEIAAIAVEDYSALKNSLI
mmetsp:Transcript_25103/g.38920  ORF Transcript_25103/g.38920 Transcript_25103/m.38920 type:complete len:135 (+) Transcript_25103:176-580(+)